MAAGGRIQGITIQLGADTRSLTSALTQVNSSISKTQKELKMVERALKFDPGNAELLRQQQELLQQAVGETTTKLDALRQAQAEVERKFQAGEISAVEYRSFQRELINTEQALQRFESELAGLGQAAQETGQEILDTNTILSRTQAELKEVERALQFDPGNAELLRQQQELLQQAVATTSTRLDELGQAQAEVERKFQAGEIPVEEYRAFQRELVTTEQRLQQFESELAGLGQEAQETGRDVGEMADGIKRAGDGIKGAGQNMLGVTAGLGAVAGAAGIAATGFDDMSAKIRNSVVGTEEELAGLEDSAKNVWREGFGESLEEVSDAVVKVKNNMKGLSGGEIEQATKSAMVLAKTFDADVNEVTRAGNNLMTNFGIDSDKAFDLMAQGAKNGLNFSGEMFDNLSEYSPLFAEMGFTGEEYFQMLVNGSQAGVYNLDYLNDVMKENQIRLKDGSKATADAMGSMSKDTQQLWKDHLAGKATVKEVSDAVLTELEGMDDQTKANQIGVALYGTKWEDLESTAMYSLNNVSDEMQNADGVMQGMIDTQEQTFGQRFQSMMRTAQESLLPLGNILLDLASKYLPPIIEKVTALGQWFADLSSKSQLLVVGIGAFIAAIGPLLIIIGSVVGALSNLVGPVVTVFGWFKKLQTVFTIVKAAIVALTTSFGLPIVIIGALVAAGVLLYKNWDLVKEKAGQLKDWVVKKFGELKDGASKAIETAKTAVTDKFNQLKTSASNSVESAKTAVTNKFNQLKTNASNAVESAKKAVVDKFNQLKTGATNIVESVRSGVTNKFNQLKTGATNAVENARSSIISKFNAVKTGISSAVDLVKSKVSNVFSNIKNLMTNPVETARAIIKTAIDKITGFFKNMKLTFPKITMPKLPSFKLDGKFSLNPPSVPKLKINWNADGGIFDKPTIFNTPAGLQGVGEAGREAILPLTEKVLGGIGKGIASTMQGGAQQQIIIQPQPIYLDGERIGEITFDTINKRQFTASQLAAIGKGVQL